MDHNSPENIVHANDYVASEGPESDEVLDQQFFDCDKKENVIEETSSSGQELSLLQVLEDVDQFISTLSDKGNHKSNHFQVAGSLESLLKLTEIMISDYDANKAKFGQNQEEDSLFIESIKRISRLIDAPSEFSSDSAAALTLNQATSILHNAMCFLDGEFRSILESCIPNNDNNNNNADSKTPKTSKVSSFASHPEPIRFAVSDAESIQEEGYVPYSSELIYNMNRIATAMISSGYEHECCMLYHMVRRNELNRQLETLGFEYVSIEDVHKTQWEKLEGQIALWIHVVKHCSSILFSGERKLCESVFSEYPSISESIFSQITLAIIVRFLSFAEAIAVLKRSAEKLFKFLDIYETLRDLIPVIDKAYPDESVEEIKSEIWAAKSRLGEAAVSIFCDLENSISRDNSRTAVPGGAVHPLTRYTMNYLKYSCEYKDTLEQVFQKYHRIEGSRDSHEPELEIKEGANEDGTPKTSPFSIQLNTVMDLLDENLDTKAKFYRDPALRYIFLMNNGRYILQKIKGSNEIHDMMGATWCRIRSSNLRQYHKGYTRETWSKVLQCLSHEGLLVNGKVQKPVLKESFKMFNALFDEIHRNQSSWIVSDEQLQSELRVSVSALVIPAYRSFLGRFQQILAYGRQTEKYIKYQPEDIENLIEDLFDGNPASMNRRRA